MTIRPRGTSWQVDVYVHGKRIKASYPTELEAKRREEELQAQDKQPVPEAPDKVWTLDQAYQRTLERVWAGRKSERTSKVNAGLVLKYFGKSTPLDAITLDKIDGFKAKLKSLGNSDATINRKLMALSKMMTVAQDRGHLPTKPKFEFSKEYKGRMRFLQPGEEPAILNTFRLWSLPDHSDFFTCLVDTGARPGELLKIQKGNCTFSINSMLTFWETKGNASRSVPMTARVKGILERRAKDHTGRLFPFRENWFLAQWHKMAVHLELDGDAEFIPYCLRHTFASRLVQAGVPIQTVSALLGHKRLQQTLTYAHLCPQNFTAAVSALEGLTAVAQ